MAVGRECKSEELKMKNEELRDKRCKSGYKMTELGEIPEDWNIIKLKDIFHKITTRNKECNKNVLTISAQFGLINQEKFFNKTVASKDNSNYYLIEKGDFAYNKSYSNGYPMGAIKVLEKYEKGIVSPLYICFRLFDENSDNNFYKYFFEYKIFEKALNNIAQEGARNHGLLNIRVTEFFNLKIIKPPLKEQQKIASILSSVDEQIEITDSLIEKTKELKKGLMQRLLTKGIGHSKFKDTEIGRIPVEWEVRKLGDVCEILDSKRIPLNEKQRINMKGSIPYYGANAIVDYINDFIFDDELILIAEDGGNFSEFRERPIAFYVTGKCWVNNHAHVLKAKNIRSSKWIFYTLVNKDITNIVQGGTRAKLNQKDLRGIYIPFPPLKEQQKIASILSSVDEQIDQYKSKKEKLKELKKGLMQKLLTGKIRVKV
jgi:type I restriction enzyme, S subunit